MVDGGRERPPPSVRAVHKQMYEAICDAAQCGTGRGRSPNVLPKLGHRNLGN